MKTLVSFIIIGLIATLCLAGLTSWLWPVKTGKDRTDG
ncbi:hypothetical protein GGR34_003733 [Microvirga flocculans]|uniref:Uncharacterized protein n=1 Tax=Microvirga flocculans TaxID=217168 RepID=A0A7W6NA20_9HYPH|nr:hypothetical protein [Microvirga flocculans]